jgi:Na+-transporting NADH:ubiquinone oxidoreductase subunit C
MKKKKKSFRESIAYTVLFMIIITMFFIGILATFYQLTLERVEKYNLMQMKTMVLNTFNLPTDNVSDNFAKFIKINEKNGFIYYSAFEDGKNLGYCFPISGSGLWGKIDALLAVTPDFSKIIRIEIVQQNETPGLGGRITERWFKKQFQDKLLFVDGSLQKYSLIMESNSAGLTEINQITGATASSKAVIDMIYKNMEKIGKEMRADL